MPRTSAVCFVPASPLAFVKTVPVTTYAALNTRRAALCIHTARVTLVFERHTLPRLWIRRRAIWSKSQVETADSRSRQFRSIPTAAKSGPTGASHSANDVHEGEPSGTRRQGAELALPPGVAGRSTRRVRRPSTSRRACPLISARCHCNVPYTLTVRQMTRPLRLAVFRATWNAVGSVARGCWLCLTLVECLALSHTTVPAQEAVSCLCEQPLGESRVNLD